MVALCGSSNSLTSSAGDQGGGAACCACWGMTADSNAASAVVNQPNDEVDIDSKKRAYFYTYNNSKKCMIQKH